MNPVPYSGPQHTPGGVSNEREIDLLRQIAVHDRAAFKELYLIYHRRLARDRKSVV